MAEIKPYSKCNYEDFGLLCKSIERTSRVAYILTIGVVGQWRRHGIATILLHKLTENLTANPILEDCKAIYLHVLTTNTAAIHFYEKSHFKRHKFLPLYYLINSAACDGYCYVRYINGGQPPPTVLYPFHPKSTRRIELLCFCFIFPIYSLITAFFFVQTQVAFLDSAAFLSRSVRWDGQRACLVKHFRRYSTNFHTHKCDIKVSYTRADWGKIQANYWSISSPSFISSSSLDCSSSSLICFLNFLPWFRLRLPSLLLLGFAFGPQFSSGLSW